ncbi:MAG TPA: DUF4097 family beta strand repeat-containing protein [Longimicrobiales bacterium]|jgi:hypothetical protein
MVKRVAGAAVALLLAMGPAGIQAQVEFSWGASMAPGRTLRVEGISGDVHAVLASGSRAEVVATKRGRESDFDEVRILVEETGDEVTVCAVYSWRDGATCDERGDRDRDRDGRRGRRSIDVSVDFEVRVPAGVDFEGAVVSGDVDIVDVRSRVRASTVSGDVFVSTSEVAWGSTVSGSIEIEMGKVDWRDLRLSTVSGDITLYLPVALHTDIEFESLSGDFRSDFDVSVRRRSNRFIGSELNGTIGDGGRTLSLKTVSGDVRIRRARGS